MSTYATLTQFFAVLPPTFVDGTIVTNASITAQLPISSAVFDSYLRERYDVPITGSEAGGVGVFDPALSMYVCWHAAYVVACNRGFNPQPGSMDQTIKINYDAAMKWLADVQNQRASVDVLTAQSEATAHPMPSVVSGTPVGWT